MKRLISMMTVCAAAAVPQVSLAAETAGAPGAGDHFSTAVLILAILLALAGLAGVIKFRR